MIGYGFRLVRMVLTTLTSSPQRWVGRVTKLSLFLLIWPAEQLLCSYLKGELMASSHEELAIFTVYCWLSLFIFVYGLARQTPPTKLFAKYRLSRLYLLETLSPTRLALSLGVLLLRIQARLSRLSALRRASKSHKVLPADPSRASRDSARYKSLIKRHE